MRGALPLYDRLQDELVLATWGVEAALVLDLGTGTGETAARVLAAHGPAGAARPRGRPARPPGRPARVAGRRGAPPDPHVGRAGPGGPGGRPAVWLSRPVAHFTAGVSPGRNASGPASNRPGQRS